MYQRLENNIYKNNIITNQKPAESLVRLGAIRVRKRRTVTFLELSL